MTKSPPVASTLDCPSASEIRVSAVALLMNATLRPSGENTPAPDVPPRSTASGLSRRRTKRRRCPFLNPTIAMALPSGAIAIPPWRPATGSTSVGKTTSRWTTSRVVEAGARHHAHPAKATAASAIAHGSACLIRGLAAALARRATIGCAVRRVERHPRFADVSQPPQRISFQAARQQLPDVRRRIGWQLAPVDLPAQCGSKTVGDRFTAKDLLPGEHLEHDNAERPDVRPLVGRFAARLLRAHVGGRAEDQACLRCRMRHRRRLREFGRGEPRCCDRLRLRETEVEHLHPPMRRDADVAGLQVTMDDAALVRFLERFRDLFRDRDRVVHGDRARRRRSSRSSPSISSIAR